MHRVSSLIILILLSSLFSSHAYSAPTNLLPPDDNEWRYAIAFPVIWMPAIKGDIDIEGGDKVDIDVSFDDILDKLSAGLMGSLSAVKGNWGVGLSMNYLKVEDETETDGFKGPIFGLPIVSPHEITTTIHLSTNDLTLPYKVPPSIRLTTGIRHFYTRINMEFNKAGQGIGIDKKVEISEDHLFDWIFGFAADHWFNERWGVTGSVDVGLLGDNDRDFNAQAFAIYRVNTLHNVWIGYRHLVISNDVKSEVDNTTIKTEFAETGPAIGWAFTF